jgi:biotin carboxyl carrier protein
MLALTEKWRRLLKLKRPVIVKKSKADVQPFTIGWRRPVIILPNKIIETNNPHLLNSIVAHEMAHIQHADDLWLRLQAVLQAVFFFHPCIWITNRQLTHFRECACDRRVLQNPGLSREQYGTSILAVLRMALSVQPGYLLSASFMSDKHQLKHRFHLLKGGCRMNLIQKLSAVLVIILIAMVALPLASQQNAPAKAAAAEITEVAEFQLPLTKGKLSAPFGPIQHPLKKKIYNHTGVDIAAKAGTPICAAADGTVIEAISDAATSKGWGLKIVIQHADGYQTAYAHMQSIDVEAGQQVKAGEIIAAVGSTGLSTGPHLHFEIRQNQEPQNPQDFLDFSPLNAK